MARSGWSASNYLSRSTGLPSALRGVTIKVVAYVPDATGAWRGLFDLTNAGIANWGVSSNSGYNDLWFGDSAGHAVGIGVTPGWHAMVFRVDGTGAGRAFTRPLVSTTVTTTDITGTVPDSTPNEFVLGVGSNGGANDEPWGEAIQSCAGWAATLTDAECLAELWSVAPRRRSNLFLDWRGMADTLDLSGTGALTLNGSLTVTDGPPLGMGGTPALEVMSGAGVLNDTFTRANESALQYPWITLATFATPRLNSNAFDAATNATDNAAYYNAPLKVDHYAEAHINGDSDCSVAVRVDPATGAAVLYYPIDDMWILYRTTGNGYATRGFASTWADGDLMRIEAEGTTFRLYKNGVLLDSFTDAGADWQTGRYAGAFSWFQGNVLYDWAAGNLGAAPATWDGAEGASISYPIGTTRRLRVQIPGSGTVRPKLQVRKVGTSIWRDVT